MQLKAPVTITQAEYVFPARFRIPGMKNTKNSRRLLPIRLVCREGPTAKICITVTSDRPLNFRLERFTHASLKVEVTLKYTNNKRTAVFSFTGDEIANTIEATRQRSSRVRRNQAEARFRPVELHDLFVSYILRLDR